MTTLYGHPKHLLSDEAAQAALAAYDRLAIFVTQGGDGLRATHAPLLYRDGVILSHIARANGQWRDAPCPALVILPGAESYISPGWYESKKRDGRAVPTWNYETIQIWGELTMFEDKARLREVVDALSARHEAGRAQPWSIEDAPSEYIDRLLGAIVGYALTPTRIEAKRKLSQEKPAEDIAGVIAGLSASADPRDQAIAEMMARTREG